MSRLNGNIQSRSIANRSILGSGASGNRPDFVSAQTSTATSSTNLTVGAPAGLAVGDILVARIVNSLATQHVPPAGWNRYGGHLAVSGASSELFIKIAEAGDLGATFVFTPMTSATRSIITAAYRPNKALDTHLDQLPLPIHAANESSFSTPVLKPRRSARLVVFVGFNASSLSASPPGGMTQRATVSASNSKQYLFDLPAARGETISKSGTLSATAPNLITETLLL